MGFRPKIRLMTDDSAAWQEPVRILTHSTAVGIKTEKGIKKKARIDIKTKNMSKLPENHTTRPQASSVDLAQMMSNLERVFRNPVNPSSLSTFRHQAQTVQEPIATLIDALSSDTKDSTSMPENGVVPASEPSLQFKPSVTPSWDQADRAGESEVHLCARNEYIPSESWLGSTLNVFQIGLKPAKEGIWNALFRTVGSVLAKLAIKGASDDILDRNIEKWTQYSPFMDVLAWRPLTFPRFARPEVKFIRDKGGENVDKA